MPAFSSSSAGAIYLNKAERIEAIRRAARRAADRAPSIRRVILFGSLVTGIPTPRSDADLLVEVTESVHSEPRDRIPELLGSFLPLPCPLDLFVLTSEEIERFREAPPPLLRIALESGIDLL